MKNVHSLFGSFEGAWCVKPMTLGLALLCLSAGGDDRFLHETPNGFWETNLVATVIGYTGNRTFMGAVIPEMDPSGHAAREVWLYSIAPTNYASITFSIHECGPWSLLSVYPTNQLFVFPASVCAKEVSESPRLSGNYNDPIIPASTITGYCPYRTFEKWFPVTDSQVKHWDAYLGKQLEAGRKRAEESRDKMISASDLKRRTGLSNRVEQAEREIQSLRRKIEDCKKQPQYFRDRIEWLKTQGVNPDPPTPSE